MKLKKIIILFILFTTVSCSTDSDSSIHLKWNKAYADDSFSKTETGLKWALSYVGATILNDENIEENNDIFTIEISKMGFSKKAETALFKIHQKIKESEEYKKNQSIDIGRYVSLLLGSSEHYYALTEMPNTFEEVVKNYKVKTEKAYINNSSVSKVHRIIQFSEQKNFNQLFISQEIDSVTGKIFEFETIELLKNGQLRFGIFDEKGNRKIAANSKHTEAGKPAKCMWCHESKIQPLFNDQMNRKGFIPIMEIQETLEKFEKMNMTNKMKVSDMLNYINFEQTEDHTFTEILYTSFMEPSAKRLALEWNMTEKEVQQKLKNFKTHIHHEFDFLGNLYHRNEIEHIAPIKSLPVSGNIREKSNQEVNYLQ